MDIHLAVDRSEPLRAQLERELRAAIRGGRMRAGAKLPSSRGLAEALGVSRGVIVEAYSQLAAEGYLVARAGHGTRIAEGLARRPPVTSAPAMAARRIHFDLRPDVPDLSLFPRREWQAAMSSVVRDLPDAALGYGPPGGFPQLRLALSDYLGRVRAVVCSPEQVFIASGARHALRVLCQTLRARGIRRVAVEDPGTLAISRTIEQAGLEVVPVSVDEHGLDIGRLDSARVDVVVLTLAHQYPTGAALAPDRRAGLIKWAQQRGTLVVEYESDAEYRYDRQPMPSLQGPAPDRVVYIGTANTTLAPAVQLAWLVVPDHLVGEMAAEHDVAHAAPSALTQATYARLLESGAIDRHLRRARRRYHARRDALIEALAHHMPQATVGGAALGLHLMASLPDGADEAQISKNAAARGVAVHALHHHSVVTAPRPPALLLGYGLLAEPAIPRAVEHLADSARLLTRPRTPTQRQVSTIGDPGQLNHRRPRASLPPLRAA
ncbi:MAG: PLP-dependent aminotransferase family protein [Solirubrobacteraceae bacterium]